MSIIRLTKQFNFEMGHALHGHRGKCASIHGHSYLLWVTVRGPVIHQPGHQLDGMVMDFAELKQVVNQHIVERLDHALILSKGYFETKFPEGLKMDNLQVVDTNPTSENMLVDFADSIGACLPDGVELLSMKLQETPTSVAEWHREDNPPATSV